MLDLTHYVTKFISIIIPNYNGGATIAKCLEAIYASSYNHFEVIVVDDCSSDNSVAIIKKYSSCKLIQLESRSGTSYARNHGATNSQPGILFFIDADCILKKETLTEVAKSHGNHGLQTVIGGSYTPLPYDKTFFSIFQSVFINYSEMKNLDRPDYITGHGMVIDSEVFKKSEGFPENFMPILEDVEFSHRLRKTGHKLIMSPDIQVRHVFNFSLISSLKNGVRKSKYWAAYSLKNKDILTDSGTASVGLKVNVLTLLMTIGLILAGVFSQQWLSLIAVPFIWSANFWINRGLFTAFFSTGGIYFGLMAILYYTLFYSVAVGIGACKGILMYISGDVK